jgi:hypothetical protein
MIIESKLSEKDFINLSFVLSYGTISMRIITGLFFLLFLFGLISVIFFPVSPVNSGGEQVLLYAAFLFIRPIMTYFTAKKNYKANQRSSELIVYNFDTDYLSIKGESFNSEFSWDKINKVTQTKNWVFIWQTKAFANAIPKHDIWEEQIDELKEILKKHQVKNNL